MVGRFIQQQQVGSTEGHHREHQARLLAAGERSDRLEDPITAEAETSEKIPQFLFRRRASRRRRRPVVSRVLPSAELIDGELLELMLREVSERKVARLGPRAGAAFDQLSGQQSS